MRPTTIDAVLRQLEIILDDSTAKNDRAGYFAALYYHVTCRVRDGIQKNEFEDGPRMEKLDVIFANMYLDAYSAWKNGQPVCKSWSVSFEAIQKHPPLVMQHLLLGMNAHINYDLGIAAVETMKNESLESIRKDFYIINGILASLVAEVQSRLNKVSPLIGLLGLHRTSADEMLINFSIHTARDGAWCFAEELIKGNDPGLLTRRDQVIAGLGRNLAYPGGWLKFTVSIIRIFEWHKPGNMIRLLRGMDLQDSC